MLYFLAVAVALAFSYLLLLDNTSEVNAVEEWVENGVVLQGLGETGMSRLSVAWMPLKRPQQGNTVLQPIAFTSISPNDTPSLFF